VPFRNRVAFLLLLVSAVLFAQVADSAAGPDPREIPVPAIQTGMKPLAGVSELPVRKELPDVMVTNDGHKVTTRRQWEQRREEMKRILAWYAVGQAPPAPGNVKGREVHSEIVLDGAVRYRLVHLTFGPAEKLGLDIGVFTPATGGPFPAIILQSGTPPGGTVLPRLPQGPNQGRGEDVLLLVGAGQTAAPAGHLQPQRLCRRHDAPKRRRQLGLPQHAFLPGLSGLRLGHPGRLGVGRFARR
jgi:hypothetical protein